jgi:hypothetical protein
VTRHGGCCSRIGQHEPRLVRPSSSQSPLCRRLAFGSSSPVGHLHRGHEGGFVARREKRERRIGGAKEWRARASERIRVVVSAAHVRPTRASPRPPLFVPVTIMPPPCLRFQQPSLLHRRVSGRSRGRLRRAPREEGETDRRRQRVASSGERAAPLRPSHHYAAALPSVPAAQSDTYTAHMALNNSNVEERARPTHLLHRRVSGRSRGRLRRAPREEGETPRTWR